MKKNIKQNFKLIPLSLLLLFSLFSTTAGAFVSNGSSVVNPLPLNTLVPVNEQVLVFDNQNDSTLPKRFRKSTDVIQNPGNLNLAGLKTLNISGSQQYSKNNLALIKNELPKNMNLVFFDLRQESHGFINGLPISWMGNGDKANEGLSRDQVIAQNNSQLASIKRGVPINIKNKSITPNEVYSEEALINANKNTYIRVTVTDTMVPTPDMVDFFVASVQKLPKNSWLHFHCKEGIGRTTTFMIMYDMMKNAKTVSMNDIVSRQLKLGNLEEKDESFGSGDRLKLLTKFYAYAKNGDFTQKFSTFK